MLSYQVAAEAHALREKINLLQGSFKRILKTMQGLIADTTSFITMTWLSIPFLQKNCGLFQKELGVFNDEAEMPIRFLDETDLKGLEQVPFKPLGKR
jgi:hypothetical protein